MKLLSKTMFNSNKVPDELGCLMLYLDINNWTETIKSIVDQEDIYEVPGKSFGYETEPHVTVLFGFDDSEVEPQEMIKELSELKKVNIKLNNITIFENENFDVVKFSVENEYLTELNSYFKDNYKYHNNYPKYKAHCTIAYVKKGKGKKYVQTIKDINSKGTKYVYSMPGREKIEVSIT